MKTKLSILLFLISSISLFAQDKKYEAISSGTSWFDQNNKEVNAHGVCIIKEGNLYYLFGEHKSDTSNMFTGFACYSSPDLMNWKFENVVLPQQKEGLLGPNRVGERPKVMKCPETGEFVMYMHCDNMGYKDPHVGYATCKTINGDYSFRGDLLHNGSYLKKWDLGSFQDTDGKGYILTHEGFIYGLSSDYKSVERIVISNATSGGESPAMFRRNGLYFWLFSHKTSWERNDNYYMTAPSLEGPWTDRGLFTPEGTLTWNSQCSFVLPIVSGKDTLNIYMGDRWSFPKQGSAATQVWQPITVKGDGMSIPVFHENWRANLSDASYSPVNQKGTSIKNKYKTQKGNWDDSDNRLQSKEKGAVIAYAFKGKQISIHAISNNTSGYAKIIIKDHRNKDVINTIVDFYSLYEYSSQKFLSPVLKSGNYTLSIEILGEHPKWSDKRKSDYGSTGNLVIIDDVFVK